MLPYSTLSAKAFPAQLTVVTLSLEILMLGLFVTVQIVFFGCAVIAFVASIRFLACVSVCMGFKLIFASETTT